MKDFVISALDGILSLAVILATIGGFFVGGNSNPFSDFSFGMALVGAAAAFVGMVISTGAIFTLIRIRELLEEQTHLLRTTQPQQASRYGSPIPVESGSASRPAVSVQLPTPTGGSLRRCPKCNAITAYQSANNCTQCGAFL